MTVFVKATMPSLPKKPWAMKAALVYSGILVVLAVTQLFSFDQFLVVVRDFALLGGKPGAYFLATVIVIAEVFALPFLLRMQVSVAMRYLSMAMGWLVALLWLGITAWLVATGSNVTNIGVFGDVVSFAPGWLSVLCGLGLSALSAVVSWGMWPASR
jgi:hypothetical protein